MNSFGRMKRILIIEDNEEIRENTKELLELSSYEVLTAENGSIGFTIAKQFKPDLVLCDMMMPVTDGREFLRLAKSDDKVSDIPIIFFSAGTPALSVHQFLVKVADGFIKKPFTKEELLSTINKSIKSISDSDECVKAK